MKKNLTLRIVFVLLLGLGLSVGMNAQVFSKGDKVISLGIGFLGLGGLDVGESYTINTPPLFGSFEYGLFDGFLKEKGSIGVGGYLGYLPGPRGLLGSMHGYSLYSGQECLTELPLVYKSSIWTIAPSVAFHYNPIGKLDLYTSLLFEYTIRSNVFSSNGSLNELNNRYRFAPTLNIGARYYFDNFAIFAETGLMMYNFSAPRYDGKFFFGGGPKLGVSSKF